MEVSNEIKEDIRKTQSDLKNAIRIHQVWVARLQEDENNIHLKMKVREAEKEIIAIGQAQKLVVDRLRRELELYQQRLKSRNRHVNIENDNRYVAQQLREHQSRGKHRSMSLLKPSVLNEIHIKSENNHDDYKNVSDSENEITEKENSNHADVDGRNKYSRSYMVDDSRNNFANALNKVKETLIGTKMLESNDWAEQRSDSDSSGMAHSAHTPSGTAHSAHTPSPSPPPLPEPGQPLTQDVFLRLVGLVTLEQKEALDKKRSERRKRATTSTNRTDFLYGNFDNMMPKRKKYNQFPYLQPPSDPPQTRSAKLRKQQMLPNKSSREGSPSGSSGETKGWSNGKPAWASALPPGLSVEPIYPPAKKVCHVCGRNDVPSLLVWCSVCNVCVHTGCADGRCGNCRAPLPEPACASHPASDPQLYKDKIAERKRLQERNLELTVQLRKLEARAATLKENLDEHNAEKRQLLGDQIKVQRNLQKLLDFISQFKETSLMQSTSSETGSELSKSYDE